MESNHPNSKYETQQQSTLVFLHEINYIAIAVPGLDLLYTATSNSVLSCIHSDNDSARSAIWDSELTLTIVGRGQALRRCQDVNQI